MNGNLGQLNAVQESVRQQFEQGGSIGGLLLVLGCIIALIVLVVLATRWQALKSGKAESQNPSRLFREILAELRLSTAEQQWLRDQAKAHRVTNPLTSLLSPVMFDQLAVKCGVSEGSSPPWKNPVDFSPNQIRAVRKKLFPA